MKLLVIPILLALTPFTAKALDLTPTASFRDLEGVKIPILVFSDAGKKIAFQPPYQWKISGGGDTLSLYPTDRADAVMQLRVRPFKPLGAEVTEDLEKWCRSLLPQDAAKPTLEGEAANIFTLGPLASREFTYSYAAQGRRFTTSVAVVDWSERVRLTVVVTARTPDFAATHEAAIGSMFSWSPQ